MRLCGNAGRVRHRRSSGPGMFDPRTFSSIRRQRTVSRGSPTGLLGHVRSLRLRQPEDGNESFVVAPHLLMGEVAYEVSEPLSVDRTQLLDEHSRDAPLDVRLGPKRCWTGTPRRRSNDDDGARKKLVCLEHHAEASALLFVTGAAGNRNRALPPAGFCRRRADARAWLVVRDTASRSDDSSTARRIVAGGRAARSARRRPGGVRGLVRCRPIRRRQPSRPRSWPLR